MQCSVRLVHTVDSSLKATNNYAAEDRRTTSCLITLAIYRENLAFESSEKVP